MGQHVLQPGVMNVELEFLPSLLNLTVQHSKEGQKGQGKGDEKHTELEALVGQELGQGGKGEMSLGGETISMTERRKNEEARQDPKQREGFKTGLNDTIEKKEKETRLDVET